MKKIEEQIGRFLRHAKTAHPQTQNDLEKIKRLILCEARGPAHKVVMCGAKNLEKTPKMFSNTQILSYYRQLVKKHRLKPSKKLEKLLRKKEVRTLSGIASIAIFTKPFPCPGKCLYCPTQPKMPKSYLSDEPAVMRAILCKYDPVKQIQTRLKTLEAIGHPTNKIELIVMGGTFSVLPHNYQSKFITNCFRACNNSKIKNQKSKIKITDKNLKIKKLKLEQKKNENAKHRIIGLTLETRPDYITEKEILWMRELGATRVELGVQSIYDDILKFNQRGHLVDKTIFATKLLKDAGFKINYHIMPNLPKSTPARDLKMFQDLFSNPDFQPDMLKIYSCVLTKNASRLKKLWQEKKYKPYSDKQLINLLVKIKQTIPSYVRIMRLGRDIPATNILAGSKLSNIREFVQRRIAAQNLKCRCIRCREIKSQILNLKSQTSKRIDYNASYGKEIFLSFEDKKTDKLAAFLRLRLPSQYFSKQKHFMTELQNAALIREIHTYGQMIEVGKTNARAAQHLGLGQKLVVAAEKIARQEFGLKKIAAISGVGVRNFWRKNGYKLEGTYMVKTI